MNLKAIVTAIGISLASLSMAHAQTRDLTPPDLSSLPPAVQTEINNAVAICVASPVLCLNAWLAAYDVFKENGLVGRTDAMDRVLGLFAAALVVAAIDLPQGTRVAIANVVRSISNRSFADANFDAIRNLADALTTGTARVIVAQIASPN